MRRGPKGRTANNRSSPRRRKSATKGPARRTLGIKPHWDERARELWYGDVLVKRYRGPAKNADIILAVFQEEGWPPAIDDPLPSGGSANSRALLKRAIH